MYSHHVRVPPTNAVRPLVLQLRDAYLGATAQ
jgi:hypothetical protein